MWLWRGWSSTKLSNSSSNSLPIDTSGSRSLPGAALAARSNSSPKSVSASERGERGASGMSTSSRSGEISSSSYSSKAVGVGEREGLGTFLGRLVRVVDGDSGRRELCCRAGGGGEPSERYGVCGGSSGAGEERRESRIGESAKCSSNHS